MPHVFELSDATVGRLQKIARPLIDSMESVIVKLLDNWDQGHTAAQEVMRRGEPVRDRQPPLHVTKSSDQLPTRAFRLPLLETMYELGGTSQVGRVRDAMRRKLNAVLRPGDLRILESNRSERWWNATEWNRHKLVQEGLFKHGSKEGIWELSAEGTRYVENLIASTKERAESSEKGTLRTFDLQSMPNLRFTKLLSARVGAQQIRPTWNGLLLHLIGLIPKDRLANPDERQRLLIVNFVPGKKEDDGYRFLPHLEISIQGQDANDAWKCASHIAQQLKVSVEVEFIWRMKEGAAYPGTLGRLSI